MLLAVPSYSRQHTHSLVSNRLNVESESSMTSTRFSGGWWPHRKQELAISLLSFPNSSSNSWNTETQPDVPRKSQPQILKSEETHKSKALLKGLIRKSQHVQHYVCVLIVCNLRFQIDTSSLYGNSHAQTQKPGSNYLQDTPPRNPSVQRIRVKFM